MIDSRDPEVLLKQWAEEVSRSRLTFERVRQINDGIQELWEDKNNRALIDKYFTETGYGEALDMLYECAQDLEKQGGAQE